MSRTERRIRSALDYLRGNLSVLRRTPLDAEQRSALQGVEESTSEVLMVLEQLRDLTSSFDDQPAQSFRFDLERTLSWVCRQFKGPMKSEGIEFQLLVSPNIPSSVLGDARRLRSVLVCLLDNALQFTGGGAVTLKVTVKGSDENSERMTLYFEVIDSGPGLSQEMRQTIRSQSLSPQSAPSLTIVQSWLSSMGSRLEMGDSEHGGHFAFKLALRRDEEPGRSHPRSSLNGKRVLIVDSSLAGRRLLEKSLHHVGASFVSCSDLEGAIHFLQTGELPDTIILDSELSASTPREAVQALMQYCEAPIVMVVPLAGPGDGARYRELGCRAYLVRPLHQEQILEALSAALAVTPGELFITTHSLEEATKLKNSVLLIADQGLLSRQTEHLLKVAGHEVTVIRASCEALRALPADLTLDLILVEYSSCEPPFLAELTRWRPDLPRIGLINSDESLPSRASLDDLLYIPLRSWELSQILSRWAGRQLQRAERLPEVEEAPPIRIEELKETTDGDEELQTEMIAAFCEDLRTSFRIIDECLERGDFQGVSAEGHALKGSAPYFGAERLAELADMLQRACKSGDANATRAVLETCRGEYQKILRFFEALNGL